MSPNTKSPSTSTSSSSSWKKDLPMQFGIPIPVICDWLNRHWEGNLDELNKPNYRSYEIKDKARHNGQNYVFALLTGYRDPPVGVSIREGLHYNPYFPGGAIAMPKMLNDGVVEYEDGTPATEAQMGKDVVSFLSWAAKPEMEERKLMGFKWTFVLSLALLQVAYYHRLRWYVLKSRKLVLDVVN
ncbi:hypothetical protein KIW84_052288 [Lathyrus oleraceus]|uniref:Uncharacterized protein n=1 Tax=Pisum sativum TaxID=3888 RepID=A0A9D5ABR7_PEA|nr:hypothetical protein KIW84_052288 [Pisum sativum]